MFRLKSTRPGTNNNNTNNTSWELGILAKENSGLYGTDVVDASDASDVLKSDLHCSMHGTSG